MANFLAIADTDRRRREQFLARTSPHLKFFDWLVLDSMTCGDFSLSWAIHPDTPFKQSTTKVGTGVLFGDAFNPGWRAIRKKAEPQLRELSQLFDQKSFDALFSSYYTHRPKSRLGRRRSPNSSGLKVLVGLALWLKDRSISW